MTLTPQFVRILAITAIGFLAGPALAVDGTPDHMVAFFMSDPYRTNITSSGCPSGWKAADYAKGRLLLATTNPERIGKTFGAPLDAKGPRVHYHDFNVSANLEFEPIVAASGGGNWMGSPAGTVQATGRTKGSTEDIPLSQLVVCEKEPSKTVSDAMPYQAISLFNSTQCPSGWGPFDKANGRFLLPLMANGQLGQAVGTPWLETPPAHNHGATAGANVPATSYIAAKAWWPLSQNTDFGRSERINLRGQTGAPVDQDGKPYAGLGYVELLACINNTFDNGNGKLPTDLVMFMGSQYCPDDWRTTPSTAGRYLIGLPDGGEASKTFGGEPLSPGEMRGHNHAIEGTLVLPAKNVAVGSGCCAGGYAQSGNHDLRGQTDSGGGLPYYTVRHCIK